MSSYPAIYSEPDEVEVQLAALGVSTSIFQTAAMAHRLGRASATRNDPPGAAGSMGYFFTVRSFRDQLLPMGWEKSDEGNYCRTISPDGGIAIVTSSGDEATGDPLQTPHTKCPKGPATVEAVEDNRAQLDLFGWSMPSKAGKARRSTARVTWMFLTFATATEVRAELSLPASIGEDDRIESWAARIILPPLTSDGGDVVPLPLPEPGPEFDVDVVRKNG